VRILLAESRRLYIRSEAGIGALPVGARAGIFAARYIYDGIGGAVRRNGHDSITLRGRTNKAQKIKLIGKASIRAAATLALPRSPVIFAKPLQEVAFLVDAAAHQRLTPPTRMDGLMEVMAELRARELRKKANLGLAAE